MADLIHPTARPVVPPEEDPRDRDLHELPGAAEHIWRGGVIDVWNEAVTLPSGASEHRDIVRHPGGVGAVAVTGDGLVALVRQYRAPFDEVTLEIPAGKLEPGEDPDEAVRRELREEAGLVAKTWERICAMAPSPGYTDEVVRIYLARDLSFVGTDPDDDEFIDVDYVRLDDAVAAIRSGAITDAKTQIGLLAAREIIG